MTVLNKVNYVDQDFSTAVTKIRQFLNTNFPDEFNDYINSNLGVALIEIIAYAEQNLLWYMNRKVTDLYFPTAKTPNSVSKIARMLGYKSQGATAAEVAVSITLTDGPYTFPVQINSGFQFQGPNNQIWEYRGDVPIVFAPGETAKSNIVLSQGETVVNSFVSTGLNNQFFELLSVPQGKFVESASVTVTVDGEEWTEQPIIPFTNENNYETNILTFPPVVRFGDGVQGNVPDTGAAIQVSYVVTDGFRGRIVSNAITEPVVGLTAQFEDIPISILQTSGSVGGDDPEDLRSIRVNAPLFQRTQDRAITKGDYDFLGNQFTNVAKSDAQIIRGVSGDVTFNTIANNMIVAVSAATTGISGDIQPFVNNLDTAVSGIFDQVNIFGAATKSSVEDETSAISGKVDSMVSSVNTTLATMRTDIQPFFDAAVTDLLDIDTESSELLEELGVIIDIKKASIEDLLDDIEDAVSGTAEEGTVDPLVAIIRTRLTALKSEVIAAATAANTTIDSETDSVRSNLDDIITEVEAVSGEIETAIQADKDCIASELVNICTSISGSVSGFQDAVSGFVDDIDTANAEINNIFVVGTSGLLDTVSGYVDDFLEHADEHLTDSCDANKVQVKVLGKDVDRKYVAPLQTTLDQLKLHLEARKDVTHTIDVISGLGDVVEADVTITVRVSDNAVEDDVLATISDVIQKSDIEPLGILVEREFNKPLYLSELYGSIRDAFDDPDDVIVYMNITIDGPSEFLDDAGNLITPASSVIQVGTINIVSLPRFTRNNS